MKISILLSIHNDEETLLTSLESIAHQTYKNVELIVVDDASSDNSILILKKWVKKNTIPTKIISHKKNIGLTKSLNKGLKKCTGLFIARLDADDWWEKNKLLEQINFLKKHPSHGYIGTFYVNHFEVSGKSKKMHLYVDDNDIKQNKFKKNPFAHSCLLIKKELLDQVNGYDETVYYGQDYNLFMRCISLTKFHNIPQYLCHRLVKKNSISLEHQKEQATQSLNTRRKFMKLYGSSVRDQTYLIEPYLNKIMPNWLKQIKRKLL